MNDQHPANAVTVEMLSDALGEMALGFSLVLMVLSRRLDALNVMSVSEFHAVLKDMRDSPVLQKSLAPHPHNHQMAFEFIDAAIHALNPQPDPKPWRPVFKVIQGGKQ